MVLNYLALILFVVVVGIIIIAPLALSLRLYREPQHTRTETLEEWLRGVAND